MAHPTTRSSPAGHPGAAHQPRLGDPRGHDDPGDCGSDELGPDEISAIRREEARCARRRAGRDVPLPRRGDGFLALDPPTKHWQASAQGPAKSRLRTQPADYLIDHEVTSTIVRDATFWSGVPNLKTEGRDPFRPRPTCIGADPVEGKDLFEETVLPTIAVDISSVIEIKTEMLRCHASQRQWLLKQHGMDEYLHAMRAMGRAGEAGAGRAYAEGFRQHLGHGYPQDDLLPKSWAGGGYRP